jgi:hypothetical protein
MGGAVGKQSPGRAATQTDFRNLIDRVTIGRTTIQIQLSEAVGGPRQTRGRGT